MLQQGSRLFASVLAGLDRLVRSRDYDIREGDKARYACCDIQTGTHGYTSQNLLVGMGGSLVQKRAVPQSQNDMLP